MIDDDRLSNARIRARVVVFSDAKCNLDQSAACITPGPLSDVGLSSVPGLE